MSTDSNDQWVLDQMEKMSSLPELVLVEVSSGIGAIITEDGMAMDEKTKDSWRNFAAALNFTVWSRTSADGAQSRLYKEDSVTLLSSIPNDLRELFAEALTEATPTPIAAEDQKDPHAPTIEDVD